MSGPRLAPWLLLFAIIFVTPVQAAAPAAPMPQLKGLTASDAQHVVDKLIDAQRAVKAGDKVYFELLSDAPATYEATLVAPRQASFAYASSTPTWSNASMPRTPYGAPTG